MNKKVAIIDDDQDILESLQLVLESSGFDTKTTPRGAETFSMVKEFQPDAILLDVLLSGLDGRSICKELKSLKLTKNIPIVMMSAHPDVKASVLEVGADDFMAKPFDTYKLIKLIQKYTQ